MRGGSAGWLDALVAGVVRIFRISRTQIDKLTHTHSSMDTHVCADDACDEAAAIIGNRVRDETVRYTHKR